MIKFTRINSITQFSSDCYSLNFTVETKKFHRFQLGLYNGRLSQLTRYQYQVLPARYFNNLQSMVAGKKFKRAAVRAFLARNLQDGNRAIWWQAHTKQEKKEAIDRFLLSLEGKL